MKKAAFSGLTILLVFLLLELILYSLAALSPKVSAIVAPYSTTNQLARILPDEELGHRPNPEYPEHDSLGFRNPEVPGRTDVLAFGDSQTYGSGVEPEQAWPKQLESRISQSVYGMAFGGYGPVNSMILWDEAVVFEPKVVIEALYSGNDLYDAFNAVYANGQHTELKSQDERLQNSIRKAEEVEPIAERVMRMYTQGAHAKSDPGLAQLARLFIARRSMAYGLLRATRDEAVRRLGGFRDPWENATTAAEAVPEYRQVYSDEQFRTVFTSTYRFSALNLNDPRIVEGLNITLRTLEWMQERALEKGIRFIVVLIPTKEMVFSERWTDPPPAYSTLVDMEDVFLKTMKESLQTNGIEFLDVLPALREQLAEGVQPYKVTEDGHPNEHGHRAIASEIAEYLAQPLNREPTPQ